MTSRTLVPKNKVPLVWAYPVVKALGIVSTCKLAETPAIKLPNEALVLALLHVARKGVLRKLLGLQNSETKSVRIPSDSIGSLFIREYIHKLSAIHKAEGRGEHSK